MWCHCALCEVIEGFVRLWNRLDSAVHLMCLCFGSSEVLTMFNVNGTMTFLVVRCSDELYSITDVIPGGTPLSVGLWNCVVWWWKGGLYNPSIFLEKENFGPLCWELKCFMPCDHFGECKLECDFVQIMIWCVHVWDVMILLFR